ncbi:MAG: hypothetical protein GWO24_05260, partial [Akkermansiaceae bacterium]|nr:hypothetical protein [Akkermansiaceae bacterium]
MKTEWMPGARPFLAVSCLTIGLVLATGPRAQADTDVLVGEVGVFTDLGDLTLDPATAVIAVAVHHDSDQEVNGVTFRTDGQNNNPGIANEGDVTVTTTSTHRINDWSNAPNFTGGTPGSAASLSQIMRDIRWSAAPNPLTVEIDGLAPNTPYEIQLLFNEGADRNRRWDIEVNGELVVDDFTSEGLHTQSWNPGNSAYYRGEFASDPDGFIDIRLQQNIGGQPSPGGDNNPILQAVIVHIAFVSEDGDDLNDPFEQRIIDADDGDTIETLEDVLEGDDFDNDGLTNLEEQEGGTDPTNPDTDDDG